MTKGTRKTGDFCWINMLTPEPAKARTFYGKLLGWTYDELPGMGHIAKVGGSAIGGLFDLAGPNTPPGTPPVIGVMVKVDSADAAGKKAAALGGKSLPAFDVMDQGRMAVCFDPNGAEFDVWEPRKGQGTDVDSELHGAPSWYENLTTDVDRAVGFYTKLFGWTPTALPMPGFVYTTYSLGDLVMAGTMKILPEMGPMPPAWKVYFTVKDADASAREAQQLGGVLCVPVQDIPNVGRFCGVTSPQGVTFFLLQYVR